MIELDIKKAEIFLEKNNLKDVQIKMIAGDASFRSYYRIFHQDKTFILMFAPPKLEDLHPFIKIDEILVKNNFSAPKIFAKDFAEGFLLLEDFGDISYSKALKDHENLAKQEFLLYQEACNCLINLHKIDISETIPLYNNELLFREVMLFVDWYLPYVKNVELNLKQKAEFKSLWFELFDQLDADNKVLVLRDYHADNLMVLNNRKGFQSVGLLDFQDAVKGSPAYDLVSLLEDARRDVLEDVRQKILEHYVKGSKCNKQSFLTDYKILSLQRNIKIIGIFARLANRDGKKHYLNFLPRVINFVIVRLAKDEELFSKIANFLKKYL